MTEFWENAFQTKQLMWGHEPTAPARYACDYFVRHNVKNVLIPGIGYGRNAKLFLAANMAVTGIEISQTAIATARKLGLKITIHHGSVADMPFDEQQYEGIFCYALIHLLDVVARKKFIADCYRQLAPGGHMIFTVITKQAPMYGKGTCLGPDWYELQPNLRMYFYDAESIGHEFGAHGLLEFSEMQEPVHEGFTLPFINVVCGKPL